MRSRQEGSRVLRGRAVRRQGQRKHGERGGGLPFMASGPLKNFDFHSKDGTVGR